MGALDARLFSIRRAARFVLPAFTTALGIQLLNVFLPSLAWYLRDTVHVATLDLIPYAIWPFLLAFLAAPLHRWVGERVSLWIAAGGVAVLRLAVQILHNPAIVLWLSSFGVALFLIFIPLYLGHLRNLGTQTVPQWFFGVLLGFGLVTALRSVIGGRELAAVSGYGSVAITALFGAGILWAIGNEPMSTASGSFGVPWIRALPMLGFGPFFVVQLLLFSSHGFIEEVTGLGSPLGFVLVLFGFFVSAMGMSLGFRRPRAFHPLAAFASAVILTTAVFYADQSGLFLAGSLLVAQFLMGWGWAVIGSLQAKPDRMRQFSTTVMSGIGMLLFLLIVFGFYLAMDVALPVPRSAFPAFAAALLGLMFLQASIVIRSMRLTSKVEFTVPVILSLLIVVPLIAWIASDRQYPMKEPVGGDVKVMTFNIHSGFNSYGRQDFESVAQVIELSQADIVGLQEVSRVRAMDGSSDIPEWLAARLEMPYLFRSTEGPIWGNAILSRYPILESGWGELPRVGKLIGRGYLWAKVDAGGSEPILVIVTHLHHLEPDSEARQEQVPFLLDFWDQRPSTIMLGDLNAEPGSPEMEMISGAGFLDSWSDSGEGAGYTYSYADPVKRIDWIWHTDDIRAESIEVIDTDASDHMPVLATFSFNQATQ